MDAAAATLISLARQVRGRTLGILQRAEPAWLTWAPAGTSNHIAWHAGHALWVQDALCVEPLTGRTELPDGWERRFGMEAYPALDPGPWPTRESLVHVLSQQLLRIESVISAADPAVLAQLSPPSATTPGFGWRIVHGLHDELASTVAGIPAPLKSTPVEGYPQQHRGVPSGFQFQNQNFQFMTCIRLRSCYIPCHGDYDAHPLPGLRGGASPHSAPLRGL